MRRSPRPKAASKALAGITIALLGLALALPASLLYAAPSRQEGPTATLPPTPTATPSPADSVLAATFADQGKVDEAIGAYLAVIEQGSSRERLAARFAVARLLLDDGRLSAAVRQLQAYLFEAPPDADVRGAQLLLAEALSILGDWEGALPLYDAYIAGGGGASAYARLGRAEALARLGRGLQADAEAQRALQAPLPDQVRLAFELTMAQALEIEQPQLALAWYDRLRSESESSADDALALWRSALIQRDLGNQLPWLNAWLTIIQQYPETPTAWAIVDEPPPIKILLDSYDLGFVYYKAGRYDDARAAFEASLAANPSGALPARASYYLAIMDENAGDVTGAVVHYANVTALDPASDLADDALWWRARLLEQAGRRTEAVADYQQLVAAYGSSDWAAEARFRLPLIAYDGGAYERAADEFASLASRSNGGNARRALLWQGKSLAAAGDEEAAESAWESLRSRAPADYYGLRAAVLLGDADGRLGDAGLDAAPEPDWPAIEAWLFATTGDDPAAAVDIVLYDRHWGLAQELLALGMRRWATGELELMLESARRDPAKLYQLSHFFDTAGLPQLSSRAAARLLVAVSDDDAAAAPLDLWRLAYPAPYMDVVREAADEEEVPDVLLLAVVRQESFFDPLAGSTAGALGLTQVIPATGEEIASELGVADFTATDLLRPALSLRFGAHYLRGQLDAFDGGLYHALAAYNGGPGNAARWRAAAGDDVDRFAAEIEFSQTRAYVELVSENVARYRQLYEGLDEPELPGD